MLEDLLVDHLIEEAVGRNVHTITNNYARAWIDLNRRETELDPRQLSPRPAAHIDQRSPRVVAGLGLIPLTSGSGRALYDGRSEEHTSELQSLMRISYAVFCLKKKRNTHNN